jgi:CelD/BcsL family acetyltransferase involved in cellulose biosynthesis
MAVAGALAESTDDLDALRAGWDDLAVAAGRPYAAPAWMLAWWKHLRRPGDRLRVVTVHRDGALVAVAPFFAARGPTRLTRYRLLGAGTSHRLEPLAIPGEERAAAQVIAATLARAEPPPSVLSFESVDARSPWPALLSRYWPCAGPPLLRRQWSGPAPTVCLEGSSFEEWMSRRSRNFRSQSRRLLRRLERQGARFLTASTHAELERGLGELARLHYARWRGRGGSVALSPAVERMLAEAGRELLPSGRFRLLSIEVDGRAISAQLFVAAGGEVSYWNGGFDPAWSAVQPSMRALVAAVEDAFARSDRRLDLGGGSEPYKYRLADAEDKLESTLLVPTGARDSLIRLQLALRRSSRAIAGRLPAELSMRLRPLGGERRPGDTA